MTSSEREYDVAISFLATDEALATQIRDALDPPLSVFLYSKKQEELAGRDGIEAFREVFGEQASVIVVLYRGGWGETKWTRVEATAIKEYCWEHGWERLILVRLERESDVPKWIPKPHLYLDFATFSLSDLIGAIKAHLVQQDVEIAPVSPVNRAAAQAKQLAFDEETKWLLSQSPNEFRAAYAELTGHLEVQARNVADSSGWDVAAGIGALIGGFIVSTRGQTVQVTIPRQSRGL